MDLAHKIVFVLWGSIFMAGVYNRSLYWAAFGALATLYSLVDAVIVALKPPKIGPHRS